MALNFQRLETEVAELGTVTESVILLLTNLAQEIRDSAANEAKINSLADQIDQRANALAAAAQANTPAEPTP